MMYTSGQRGARALDGTRAVHDAYLLLLLFVLLVLDDLLLGLLLIGLFLRRGLRLWVAGWSGKGREEGEVRTRGCFPT